MKIQEQRSLRFVIALALFLAVFLGFLLAQSSASSPGDGLQFQILDVQINEARRPAVTFLGTFVPNYTAHTALASISYRW